MPAKAGISFFSYDSFPKILFKSEVGQIQAAEAETYGLLTGDRKQTIKADIQNIGKAAPITVDRVYQPNVSFQVVLCHILCFSFAYKRAGTSLRRPVLIKL